MGTEGVGFAVLMDNVARMQQAVLELSLNADRFIDVDKLAVIPAAPVSINARPRSS
ncbi:hypothetical protein ACCS70_27085 [Rhizobium ruizarguesonis]